MIIGKVMVDLRVGTKCFWACFFKNSLLIFLM
jgi:hypothetical protein